jgi:class 3 adenylate cyclase
MSEAGDERSYEELAAICARFEAESGHNLVMQRDLIYAKDQVDDELMRFKAIQAFITRALDAADEAEFFNLTLESLIEAFEHEVGLFLLATGEDGVLRIASEFGFEDAPGTVEFSPDWIDPTESQIFGPDDVLIEAWPDLGLASAIICPFHDKIGGFAGAILSGITREGADFYKPITGEHSSAFTVMVRQAGALLINRQLNDEIRQHNQRLSNLTKSYSRFVPFQFLDLLERSSIEDINAGDHVSLDMSVLFADIRGFTTLSEKLGPAGTFSSLNEFLVSIEPEIGREQGFINHYLGDAIMALFPGPSDAALRCASAMLDAARTFNDGRVGRGDIAIRFGLGISSGPLMLGAIGGGGRLDSNVVGDTANLASRIEGLTKVYGVTALFTEFTFNRLSDPSKFSLRELDRVVVKGRSAPVTIFELLDCEPEPAKSQKLATQSRFAEGLSQYRAGAFDGARVIFEDCVSRVPDDRAAALFASRCANRSKQLPVEQWQGISEIDEK